MKWFNIYIAHLTYLLLATAVYPRLRVPRCRFSHFSENPWFLYGEWASAVALFFHFFRPKEVSSLIFLSHTRTYSVHQHILLVLPPEYLQNMTASFPTRLLSLSCLPFLLGCSDVSILICLLPLLLLTPVSELYSLHGGRNKCFQTFHSSAQKASSVIQSCWVCLKTHIVLPFWPLFTPHQPQASSLFLRCPRHTSASEPLLFLLPGLHGPSSGQRRVCSLLALFRSLLLSSVREALLTPKLKQRAFIPTVTLCPPTCLSYRLLTT